MCTISESPSALSRISQVVDPIVKRPPLIMMLGGASRSMGTGTATGRLPRKKRPVPHCASLEQLQVLLTGVGELQEDHCHRHPLDAPPPPRPLKRRRASNPPDSAVAPAAGAAVVTTAAAASASHAADTTNGRDSCSSSTTTGRKKAVRICEASNRSHEPPAAIVPARAQNEDGDGAAALGCHGDGEPSGDGDSAQRWYQPSDYARFREAAVQQLSAWMSSNSDSGGGNGGGPRRTAIPRGLEPLYHRVVLKSTKQRQLYASLIVWKHRVLVHRRQNGCGASDTTPATVMVEDVVRALSEPLTEPDRVRAYRMATPTATTTISRGCQAVTRSDDE